MITASIIILAWTTGAPLWASITATALASVRLVGKFTAVICKAVSGEY